jgi:hypothetical protein
MTNKLIAIATIVGEKLKAVTTKTQMRRKNPSPRKNENLCAGKPKS